MPIVKGGELWGDMVPQKSAGPVPRRNSDIGGQSFIVFSDSERGSVHRFLVWFLILSSPWGVWGLPIVFFLSFFCLPLFFDRGFVII